MLNSILDTFWKWRIAPADDYVIPLNPRIQRGSIMAVVYPFTVWRKEPLLKKLKCVLTGKWIPDEADVMREAHEVLVRDVFGG